MQKLVTMSTTESEYVALAATVQEVLYLRAVLKELGFTQTDATAIGEDNQATIKIAKNPEHHGRCKHMDLRFFFVQERVKAQDISVYYVPSEQMLADIMTKSHQPHLFVRLRQLLGVMGRKEALRRVAQKTSYKSEEVYNQDKV